MNRASRISKGLFGTIILACILFCTSIFALGINNGKKVQLPQTESVVLAESEAESTSQNNVASRYWEDYATEINETQFLAVYTDDVAGGTKYIEISEASELAWIAVNISTYQSFGDYGDYVYNLNFRLMADIDLSSKLWIPIGTSSTKYIGIFDGNGHKITGVSFDTTQGYAQKALFGYTNGATIKDLIVTDCVGSSACLVGSATNTKFYACATDDEMTASGGTFYHCEIGGSTNGNADRGELFDGVCIGTNNLYYEIILNDNEGSKTIILQSTGSSPSLDITSSLEGRTVTAIKISYYDYSYDAKWRVLGEYSTTLNSLEFLFTAEQESRSCPGTASSQMIIRYAQQSAFKIEVSAVYKVTLNYYQFNYNGATVDQASSYLSKPDSEHVKVFNPSELIKVTFDDKTHEGGDSAELLQIQNNSLTISYDTTNGIKYIAGIANGKSKWNNDSKEKEINIPLSSGAYDIYFLNVKTVTLNYSTLGFVGYSAIAYGISGDKITANSRGIGYIVYDLPSGTAYGINNVTDNNGLIGSSISNVHWMTDYGIETFEMNGTHITDSEYGITSIASFFSKDGISNVNSAGNISEDKAYYCLYLLGANNVHIKNSSGKTIELKWYNPYTVKLEEFSKTVSSDESDAVAVPKTYGLVIWDVNSKNQSSTDVLSFAFKNYASSLFPSSLSGVNYYLYRDSAIKEFEMFGSNVSYITSRDPNGLSEGGNTFYSAASFYITRDKYLTIETKTKEARIELKFVDKNGKVFSSPPEYEFLYNGSKDENYSSTKKYEINKQFGISITNLNIDGDYRISEISASANSSVSADSLKDKKVDFSINHIDVDGANITITIKIVSYKNQYKFKIKGNNSSIYSASGTEDENNATVFEFSDSKNPIPSEVEEKFLENDASYDRDNYIGFIKRELTCYAINMTTRDWLSSPVIVMGARWCVVGDCFYAVIPKNMPYSESPYIITLTVTPREYAFYIKSNTSIPNDDSLTYTKDIKFTVEDDLDFSVSDDKLGITIGRSAAVVITALLGSEDYAEKTTTQGIPYWEYFRVRATTLGGVSLSGSKSYVKNGDNLKGLINNITSSYNSSDNPLVNISFCASGINYDAAYKYSYLGNLYNFNNVSALNVTTGTIFDEQKAVVKNLNDVLPDVTYYDKPLKLLAGEAEVEIGLGTSYIELLKYLNNGSITLTAVYFPKQFGLTVTTNAGGTVDLGLAQDTKVAPIIYVYGGTDTVIAWLDGLFDLDDYYIGGFVDRATQVEYTNGLTLNDVISKIIPDGNDEAKLYPIYNGNVVEFKFKIGSAVLGAEETVKYSHPFGYGQLNGNLIVGDNTIDWGTQEIYAGKTIQDYNESYLADNNIRINSWNYKNTGDVAKFVSYSAGVLNYSFGEFKPTDYTSGKYEYNISTDVVAASLTIYFDGTYIGGIDKNLTVSYKDVEVNLGSITAERPAFEFAYWGAQTESGDFVYILDGKFVSDVNTKQSVEITESLKFYAYWNFGEVQINLAESGRVTREYELGVDPILMATITNYPKNDNLRHLVHVYKNGVGEVPYIAEHTSEGIKVYFGNPGDVDENGKFSGVYYVENSGIYYIKYCYYLADSDQSNARSGYYVLNYSKNIKVDNDEDYASVTQSANSILTITPKQLQFNGEVTKVYDGNTNVNQGVTGIIGGEITVTANYATANAGTGIAINFTVSGNDRIKACYALPNNTGTITPFQIRLKLDGQIKLAKTPTEKYVILSGAFNGSGIQTEMSQVKGVVVDNSNQEALKALLGTSRQINFEIGLNAVSLGMTYSDFDYSVEVVGSNGAVKYASENANYVFDFSGSSVKFDATNVGETIYHIYLRSGNQPAVGIAAMSTTDANLLKVTDFEYNLTTDVDNYDLNLKLSFQNTNYWIDSVLDGTEEINFNVSSLGGYDYQLNSTLSLNGQSERSIYINLTNVSTITFEYGEYVGETVSMPQTYLDENGYGHIEFGSSYSNLRPSRNGLVFEKWAIADEYGQIQGYVQASGTWNIKSRVTLYAMWSLSTTISFDHAGLLGTYNTQEVVWLEASVSNASNSYIQQNDISYGWLVSNFENGPFAQYANTYSISLKNAQDKYYKFDYSFTDQYYSGTNILIVNANISGLGDVFHVQIEKKNLGLAIALNKQFDGTDTRDYTIVSSEALLGDDLTIYGSEINGEHVTVYYQNANVGGTILRISELDNYTFTASGTITKRLIALDIGEEGTAYTGDKITLSYSDYNDGTVKLSNIKVTTSGVNVGVYSGDELTLSFNSALMSGTAIDPNYLDITLLGSIEITEAELTNITFDNVKTYNGANQNITVLWNGSAISSANYTIKNSVGSTYNGRKNAGTDDSLTVTIKIPNYQQYVRNDLTFTVNPAGAYVYVKNNDIVKTYNGTTDIDLVYGTDYDIYTNSSKTTSLSSTLANELKGELQFNFAEKNVGNNKQIIPTSSSENFVVSFDGILRGTIQKVQAKLKLKATYEKTYDERAISLRYDLFEITDGSGNVVDYGDVIVGGSVILSSTSAINVGLYNLSDLTGYDVSISVSGNVSISYNYNVIGLLGQIQVNASGVTVTKGVSSFTYNSQVHEFTFTATRNSDGSDITSFIEVKSGEAFGTLAGNYQMTIGLISGATNYSFGGQTLTYTIAKYALTLEIKSSEATQSYNGDVFRKKLENSVLTYKPCGSDYIGEIFAVTDGSYVATYYYNSGLTPLYLQNSQGSSADVVIYNKDDIDVTASYELTYNLQLEIIKGNIQDFVSLKDVTYTYNSQNQELLVTVEGVDYAVTYSGELIAGDTVRVEYVYFKDNVETSGLGFKYAGTYKVTLSGGTIDKYSGDYIQTIAIGKKEISSVTFNHNKPYDGTTTVVNQITSSDVCTTEWEDIYAGKGYSDTYFVKIEGNYGNKNIGTSNISISIIFSDPEDKIDERYIGYIQNSYKINLGSYSGEITKRPVTFTYSSESNIYYTARDLKLAISAFTIQNALISEPFGGYITFESTTNSNTYSLSSKTADLTELTVTDINEGSTSLDNYAISFAGSVTVNKAQIVVASVANNNYEYDGNSHHVSLVARIYEGRGEFGIGDAERVLTATYSNNTSGGVDVSETDAGNYYIYPAVDVLYTSNYQFVLVGYYSGAMLVIEPKPVLITISHKEMYDAYITADYEYTTNTSVGLIGSHMANISIRIARSNYTSGTFSYVGSYSGENNYGDFDNICIEITNAGADYTNNYQISCNISVTVDNSVQLYQLGEYIYNSQNRISDIELSVSYDAGGVIGTQTIKYGGGYSDGTNIFRIDGFYASENNASNDVSALSVVINSGTYFARVYVKTSSGETIICPAITIDKKSISSFAVLDTGALYVGNKVYDATETIALTSSDIYQMDKNAGVSILATYYENNSYAQSVKDVGYWFVVFEIQNDTYQNYKLSTYSQAGSILKREITITAYNGENYRYLGYTTHAIDYQELSASGLVSGHELRGTISLTVNNVGEYVLSSGTSNLTVLDVSGGSYVTTNYNIVVNSEVKVRVNPTDVTINYNGGTLTYNCSERKDDVISSLVPSGTYTVGAVLGITSIAFVYNGDQTYTLKEVGNYRITGISGSSNFNYIVGSNNIVEITQKDISIDLGVTAVKYLSYDENGYSLNTSMVAGSYADDDAYFLAITYKVSTSSIVANTIYLYEDGEIDVNITAYVNKNYNITEIVGGIEILAEEIEVGDLGSVTYDGTNHYSEIEFIYTHNNAEYSLDHTDASFRVEDDQESVVSVVRNAGIYTVYVTIYTVEYSAEFTVNPKQITTGSISYVADKTYDGTNLVYNLAHSTSLASTDVVSGDNIIISATYASNLYSAGLQTITFDLSGTDSNNYYLTGTAQGRINKFALSVPFGTRTFTYTALNNYSMEYDGALTLAGNDLANSKVLRFALINNYAPQTVALLGSTANIDACDFVIVNSSDVDVTYCYEITFSANLVFSAQSFEVSFNGFDNDRTTFDTTAKTVDVNVIGTMSEDEKEAIKRQISISYKSGGLGAVAINVGSYTATAVYGGINYVLSGTNTYMFDIVAYTYNVSNASEIKNFSKEYATEDPVLAQSFNITISGNNYSFEVDYERQAGEQIGIYDLRSAVSRNANVVFACDAEYLKDKFSITKNSNDVLTVNITSFKNQNDAVRYYGIKDIEKFNLTLFNYTLGGYVDDSLAGTIVFDSGGVGTYGVKASGHVLTSDNFINIKLVADALVTYEIKARTLVVSSSSYDKTYDQSTKFLGALTYNFNTNSLVEGALDENDILALGTVEANVVYDNLNVGNRNLIVVLIAGGADNFNVSLVQSTGKINKLNVEINVDDIQAIYGEVIKVPYEVVAQEGTLTSDKLLAEVNVYADGAGTNLSSAGKTKVGTYNIIAVSNGNVEITNTLSSTLTVGKKTLTVNSSSLIHKAQDESRLIDITPFGVTISGKIGDDDVTVNDIAEFAENKIGVVELIFTLDGMDSENYDPTTLLGEITEKQIAFNFNYTYSGCEVGADEILNNTITTIMFDYNKSVAGSGKSLPTPSYDGNGFKFIGWSLTEGGVGIDANALIRTYVTPYTESVELYAIWQVQYFNVAIVISYYTLSAGGFEYENALNLSIAYEGKVSYEDISKTLTTISRYNVYDSSVISSANFANRHYLGYGENSTVTLFDGEYRVVGDCTIYLVYALDEYTVTFNANNGYFNIKNAKITYHEDTAQITVMYGQEIGNVLIPEFYSADRTGYNFVSWQKDGVDVIVASLIVTSNVTLVANWSAKEFKLILDANGGAFETLESDWNYLQVGDTTKIYKAVKYDALVPETDIAPTKANYTFGYYYEYEYNGEYVPTTTWTQEKDVTLYAKYNENSYKIKFTLQNASAFVLIKDTNDATLVSETVTSGGEYTVKTEYTAQISVNAFAGYSVVGFNCAQGYADETSYKFDGFGGNDGAEITLEILVAPNLNRIELVVNNPDYGYIVAQYGANTYVSNTANSVLYAYTGESITITVTTNIGYKFENIAFTGSGNITEVSDGVYTFSDFVSDSVIIAKFDFADIVVNVVNGDRAKGSFKYDGRIYTTSKEFSIKTNETISLELNFAHGYTFGACTDVYGFNGSALFVENILEISGFKQNCEIEITYTEAEYEISFIYAEYDETNGAISPVANEYKLADLSGTFAGLALLGTEVYNESVYYARYTSTVQLATTLDKTGYKLYGFRKLLNGNLTNVGTTNENTLTLSVDNDYSIYIVYERVSYTISFTNANEMSSINIGGARSSSAQMTVRFGRTIPTVSANLLDEYRKFVGWYEESASGNQISTNLELSGIVATGNMTYVAYAIGKEYTFNVVIETEDNVYATDSVNNFIVLDSQNPVNVSINSTTQSVIDEKNIIVINISYRAGDNVKFTLYPHERYVRYIDGLQSDDMTFELSDITPARYDTDENYYKISLFLKIFSIVIKANIVEAVQTSIDTSLSLGIESVTYLGDDITGDTLYEIGVKYGGTIAMYIEIVRGYSYRGQTSVSNLYQFVFNGNYATLANITNNDIITITAQEQVELEYETQKYKVVFHGVFPDETSNTSGVYYILHGEQVLKDAEGNTKALESWMTQNTYNVGEMIYALGGWSISQNSGAINKSYSFDANGNIFVIGGEQFFSGGIDNSVEDADGYVVVDLYSWWYLPTNRVNVEIVDPAGGQFAGDISTYFVTGKAGIFVAIDETTGEFEYFEVAQGVTIEMYNVPEITDYMYYGWSLGGDGTNISDGTPYIQMGTSEISIYLYYSISVAVETEQPESAGGANSASVDSDYVLYGQTVGISAVAVAGYEFAYWLVNGVKDETLGENDTYAVTIPTIFTAVFVAKSVEIQIGQTEHLTISVNSSSLKVGDTLMVYLDLENGIEYGYRLNTIVAVSGENTYMLETLKTDASGKTYFEHIVNTYEGEIGLIVINATVNVRPLQILFQVLVDGETDTTGKGGVIVINDIQVENSTRDFTYGQELIVTESTIARYRLVKIVVNGTELTSTSQLYTTLNSTNGFNLESVNTIQFVYEKLYWINTVVEMSGAGTEESPYLIESPEQLAYLAWLINVNKLDQIKTFYYRIAVDIDLTEKFWIPIGTEENPFDGVFELGEFHITGVNFAENYEQLSWSEYCYGVFGYLGEHAKIIIHKSSLPVVIIALIIGASAALISLVIIVVVSKRNKRIKQLSESLAVNSANYSPDTSDILSVPDENEYEEVQPTKQQLSEVKEPEAVSVDDIIKKAQSENTKTPPKKPPQRPKKQ